MRFCFNRYLWELRIWRKPKTDFKITFFSISIRSTFDGIICNSSRWVIHKSVYNTSETFPLVFVPTKSCWSPVVLWSRLFQTIYNILWIWREYIDNRFVRWARRYCCTFRQECNHMAVLLRFALHSFFSLVLWNIYVVALRWSSMNYFTLLTMPLQGNTWSFFLVYSFIVGHAYSFIMCHTLQSFV